MMKPTNLLSIITITFIFYTGSYAGTKIVPIEGVNFTTNTAIMENLNGLTGKKVSITLDSGKEYSGKIKSVGGNLLHLEKIERKEFFDALIRIDRIQAIETRFRKYQR